MPRGTNDKGSSQGPMDIDSGARLDRADKADKRQPLPAPPGFGATLEEAWHGWLKPVGGIVGVVVAYFLYEYGILPDATAGRVLVALIVGACLFAALEPVLPRMTTPKNRYLLYAFAAVWAISAIAPVFRTVVPGKDLASAILTGDKADAVKEIKLPDGETGPYEIDVSGTLRGTAEATASYSLEVKGDGDATAHVDGELSRTFFRQRVSRKSAGTAQVRTEDNENLHRLPGVRGNKLTVTAEIGGEQLDNGLHVVVHHAWPSPYLFWLLGFLVFIGGVMLDYMMVAPKSEPTYVATLAAFTLVFAIYYPTEATPHNLVRPAIAAVILAALAGALPGWMVSKIANSFKPRPKKLAGIRGS